MSPVGCGDRHQTAGQRDGQCVHGHCDCLQHPGAELLLRHTGRTTPDDSGLTQNCFILYLFYTILTSCNFLDMLYVPIIIIYFAEFFFIFMLSFI